MSVEGARERWPAIGRALDASAELEAMLRDSGMLHAAAHAHDATAALRLSATLAERLMMPEVGKKTSAARKRNSDTIRDERPSRSSPIVGPLHTVVRGAVPRDLGWELVASKRAVAFAEDDQAALLLRHSLCELGWIALDGTRWSTSWTGASTIVRLMRAGRPLPMAVADPRPPCISGPAPLLMELGWRPERVRDLGPGT